MVELLVCLSWHTFKALRKAHKKKTSITLFSVFKEQNYTKTLNAFFLMTGMNCYQG